MSGPPQSLGDEKSPLAKKLLKLSRSSAPPKILSRAAKRTTPIHNHTSVLVDGRHKRVWKACERCRMKKTKCDGESPCKRCKDDGLVCTAGSRKKAEFKQTPRGYAEVLENNQYSLIATVHKLYTMVRNQEPWDLGEPDMNDKNLPVIHDIASKLGCIRVASDLPSAFPEGADDLAKLREQLQSTSQERSFEVAGSRKHSSDASASSPSLDRTDRASSSESGDSSLSKEYNQMLWPQGQLPMPVPPNEFMPLPNTGYEEFEMDAMQLEEKKPFGEDEYQPRLSVDSTCSMSSVYGEASFSNPTSFPVWSTGDGFLTDPHALEATANFLSHPGQYNSARTSQLSSFDTSYTPVIQMQVSTSMNYDEPTITPSMLNCNPAEYGVSYANSTGRVSCLQ